MKTKDLVQAFLAACEADGWIPSLGATGSILQITARFTPGSLEEFANLDRSYWGILSRVPQPSAGSVWGTDGGGVGAVQALRTGRFTMNVSGVSKRFLTQLAKQLATSA